jgi:TolB-like protein
MKGVSMKPNYTWAQVLAVFFATMVFLGLPTRPATAQDQADIAATLSEALDLYGNLEFDKGIGLAESLLKKENLTAADSVAIYEVLGIITYAKGEEFKKNSFDYLKKMTEIGPCLFIFPRDIWPKELRDQWYMLSKAKNLLVCPEEANPKIQTIAIMEFDNHSIGRFQETLGYLSKGLADFFQHDFAKLSTLKVVERDKIDFILRELELQQSGKVDMATAARAGKLLGAQLMVFGSITQLDDKNARMIVRVVKVETSEIIASAEKEGKPDYVTMEKELVRELAEKLDLAFTEDTEKLLEQGGSQSMDAVTLYSKGLSYMDKYDYEKAYEFFKMAYQKDPHFAEAKRKMDIYRPLIG